jgi:hypothetical protein
MNAKAAEKQDDKPATDNKGIWEEAASFLKTCEEAESDNREKGIEAKKFRWGDQWTTAAQNAREQDGRPCLTINHTNVWCGRLENTLRQQRPRIKCHPKGEGANKEGAERINGLIRHIEDISTSSIAYDNGAENAIDIGWGYWRIVSEYVDKMSFDQELFIKPIRNPFTVFMDPAAVYPDGRDQKKCLITEIMPRAEYRMKYPKAENADFAWYDPSSYFALNWESRTHVRLAEYYRIYEIADELLQLSDGQITLKSALNPNNREMRDILAAMQLTVANHRPTTRCAVQWFRLNGTNVVDSRTDPPNIYFIPVVRCEGNVKDINGQVMRKGMVQDLIDPARMYNYVETQKTERYALAPKAPWVAAEGQLDGHPEWNDANQKNYSTLVYKPKLDPTGTQLLPPPQRQPPAQAEAGMAEWSSSAERNLMAVAGMQPENPEIQARVVSGNKYLQRRQGMQDLTHFQYYDKQTLAIMWTGVLLLERIPVYYDTQRQQRILGEDGRPEVITINESVEDPENPGVKTKRNDMTVGRYQVVMDTGPGYVTKQEENAEYMLELVNTPLGEKIVQTGADIVLRNMSFPGADELADRVAIGIPGAMDKIMQTLPKQAQTIIGSLQAQLEQAGKMNEQLQLELKYKAGIQDSKNQADDQRNVRDNVTKLHIAGVDQETKLHVEESRSTTSRDVAEIDAAAQLLNTRVESEHEERAADKLIKAGTTDRE